jgi:hypothetical protein
MTAIIAVTSKHIESIPRANSIQNTSANDGYQEDIIYESSVTTDLLWLLCEEWNLFSHYQSAKHINYNTSPLQQLYSGKGIACDCWVKAIIWSYLLLMILLWQAFGVVTGLWQVLLLTGILADSLSPSHHHFASHQYNDTFHSQSVVIELSS